MNGARFSWGRVRTLHVALAAFAWFAATAWMRPLTAPDEGRYASVALQMLQSGDWLVPRLDGLPFFHKPPLFYWLGAAAMQVFGVNEWAARFPSLLGATLAVASVFAFLRQRVVDSRVAALAALVLATMPYTYVGAQFANLDMLVAGVMSTALCAGAEAVMRRLSGEPWRWMLTLAFALTALGVLAKGLIGVVLPLAILGLWALRPGTWRRLLPMLAFAPGWAVFAVIALPWFVAVQLRYPGFFDYFVVTQHFRRFAQSGFNNSQPFWFFIPVIALLAMPWPAWGLSRLRPGSWKLIQFDAVDRFMLAWFGVVLVFFSIPQSKLIGYVLPALPPAAYFIALWATAAIDRSAQARAFVQWTGGTAAVLCLAAAAGLAWREQAVDGAAIRSLAGRVQPGDRVVMLDTYHYEAPFYWRLGRDVEVAADWTQSVATARDNWRKELYDAGSFDLARRDGVLVAANTFGAKNCDAGTTWVVGTPGLAVFKDVAPVVSRGSISIWRLAATCVRTPGWPG